MEEETTQEVEMVEKKKKREETEIDWFGDVW